MSVLDDLISQITDKALKDRIATEVEKLAKQKKFGLVFEEHLPECTPLYDVPIKKGAKVALKSGKVDDFYTVLKIKDGKALCLNKDKSETKEYCLEELISIAEFGEPIYPYLKPIDTVCNAPDSSLWHTLIEADNYHALQLLEYLYAGKVDCIYIDPPYNKPEAHDWKYNNNYVDNNDQYRHSKWLSMIQKRLEIAKKLLNPKNSVLIITIDEKEYLHLGCLLEEMFKDAKIQMVSCVIKPEGSARQNQFARSEEYIFYVMFGDFSISHTNHNMLIPPPETINLRHGLARGGKNGQRLARPNLFYPILFNEKTGEYCGVDDPLPAEMNRNMYKAPKGQIAVFPIGRNGNEVTWGLQKTSFQKQYQRGMIQFGKWDLSKKTISSIKYMPSGPAKKFMNEEIKPIGKDEYGMYIFEEVVPMDVMPVTTWFQDSHNATTNGTQLLAKIFNENRFSYPKSLYAVHDTIYFCVANKPNALIVDFFAGSGTTLHAVNLLNTEDGGNRRCILVTNNEVSESEAKKLKDQGYKPGDYEWEKLGIARYVTWPRTVCSIEGHDISGKALKGSYIGSDLPMSDGFETNAAYFKLSFLDKNAVALGRQFKEMLPTLWMKAGAIGKCPKLPLNQAVPDMLVLPENKFAVLVNEKQYIKFAGELDNHPEIETVFIITDSEPGYRDMITGLKVKDSYQLYRDYLDNFRINAVRR